MRPNLTKRINIGSFNRKINFLMMTEGTNSAGDTILIPSIFKTVLASLTVVDGRDYFEAKKLQAELTYMITTRYLRNITPDMQIQYQERIFLIQDLLNVQEKNEFYVIMAIERVVRNG